jgi:predicted Zn-dependent peptidase
MLCDGPSDQDPRRFAADVLCTILGDRTGSRFYWALVDKGLVEDASMGHSGMDGAGMYQVYVNAAPENADDALGTVRKILDEVQDKGVTAAELEQAKVKHAAAEVISAETPRGRLFPLGGNWLSRREYRSVGDDLSAIRAVTLDDVRALLSERPFDRMTTVTIGPAAEGQAPDPL